MKNWVLPIAICGLAGISGFTVSNTQDEVHPKGQYTGLEAHETHASASLLGQFRTSITGWLWVRTDLYLHNGVVMRPLTDQESSAGHKGVGTTDTELNEGAVVTVVPSAERDFRGIFGDIERASQAYRNMTNHSHNNPKAAMPLYRLMTWVDPNFVTGWTTGGAVLAMGKDATTYPKAIQFLSEGLAANPDSIAILNQLGFTYTTRLRDFSRAIVSFERARSTGKRYGLQHLPEDELESLQYVYRWLSLVYRETGQLTEMHVVLREGKKLFPDDAVLDRLLNVPPHVLAPGRAQPPADPEEHAGHEGHEHHH